MEPVGVIKGTVHCRSTVPVEARRVSSPGLELLGDEPPRE